MALPQTPRLTLEEFLALPDQKPHREFIGGQVVAKPMTDRSHILLVSRIIIAIYEYIATHGGKAGPEGSVLFEDSGDRRVLLPDVAYWGPTRPMGGFPMSPPTLAVEVRSPSQSMPDQQDKCRYYAAHGIDIAWLVDPDGRTVEVFSGESTQRFGTAEVLRSSAMPGFELSLERLFVVLDDE